MMSGVRRARADLQLGLLEVCRVDVASCRGIALLEGPDEMNSSGLSTDRFQSNQRFPSFGPVARGEVSDLVEEGVMKPRAHVPLDDDQDLAESPGLRADGCA